EGVRAGGRGRTRSLPLPVPPRSRALPRRTKQRCAPRLLARDCARPDGARCPARRRRDRRPRSSERTVTTIPLTRGSLGPAMGKVSAVFVPLTFVAVLCSFASPAGADTIRVTSGVVDTAFGPPREPLDGEDLDLRAAGFEISSALEDEHAFVRLANPPTVVPGALVDFSGTLRVEDSIGAQ